MAICIAAAVEIFNLTGGGTAILIVIISIVTERWVRWQKDSVSTHLSTDGSWELVILKTVAETIDWLRYKPSSDIAREALYLLSWSKGRRDTAIDIIAETISQVATGAFANTIDWSWLKELWIAGLADDII